MLRANPSRSVGSLRAMAASFYDSVASYVEHAAVLLDVEDDARILISEPYRQVDMHVPIHADDGSVLSFRGYRSSTMAYGDPSTAGCAITGTPTSTTCGVWLR
jgi:glutamate dehydrogenase/leucine dehydrogenase